MTNLRGIKRRRGAHRICFTSQLLLIVAMATIVVAKGNRDKYQIEDPGGKAMRSFYTSLLRTSSLRVGTVPAITRIIHYGDSHIAADILTGALRQNFRTDFRDAGPGFILAGRPWSYYAPGGVRSGTSPGWHIQGLRQTDLIADGKYGLAGISFSTDRASEWVRLTAVCRTFDIYLLSQPKAGEIEVLVDGNLTINNYSLDTADYKAAYLKIDAGSQGTHSIEIRTLTNKPITIFGVDAEREESGIIYDELGINGARANRLLSWDWQILASNIKRAQPNLIIVAYGTNEVGDADLDLSIYRANLAEILKRLHKAAPNASLLVVAPPDRAIQIGRRWHSIGVMSQFVKIQRQVALSSGAAFWDLFDAMGGAGSVTKWAKQSTPYAQADHVHLTSAGYKYVADMLYQEMMRGYNKYVSAERSGVNFHVSHKQ